MKLVYNIIKDLSGVDYASKLNDLFSLGDNQKYYIYLGTVLREHIQAIVDIGLSVNDQEEYLNGCQEVFDCWTKLSKEAIADIDPHGLYIFIAENMPEVWGHIKPYLEFKGIIKDPEDLDANPFRGS